MKRMYATRSTSFFKNSNNNTDNNQQLMKEDLITNEEEEQRNNKNIKLQEQFELNERKELNKICKWLSPKDEKDKKKESQQNKKPNLVNNYLYNNNPLLQQQQEQDYDISHCSPTVNSLFLIYQSLFDKFEFNLQSVMNDLNKNQSSVNQSKIYELLEIFPHLTFDQMYNIYVNISNCNYDTCLELLLNNSLELDILDNSSTIDNNKQNHFIYKNLQQVMDSITDEQFIKDIHSSAVRNINNKNDNKNGSDSGDNNSKNKYFNNLIYNSSLLYELEKEYLIQLKEKKFHQDEYELLLINNGNLNSLLLEENNNNNNNGDMILNKDIVNNNEETEEERIEKEILKKYIVKEQLEVKKKLIELKLAKNVTFYCKEEYQLLQNYNIKENDNFKIYNCPITNIFDIQSAEYIHPRLVESQFYRILTETNGYHYHYYDNNNKNKKNIMNTVIKSVEYVVNPKLLKRFEQKKKELAKKHGFLLESMTPLLLWHGTSEENMNNIIKTNFLMEKISANTGNFGAYGKGIYFSEFATTSMGYARGAKSLLLCKVLMGKVYLGGSLGAPLTEGYDCHVSPDGRQEIVIYDTAQILPLYKLTWEMQSDCTIKNEFIE